VFHDSCGECHTATGHETNVVNGDVALSDLSAPIIASFVRVMPVRLSRADVAAVAAYVHAAEPRR
jgi:mono/diheme cytochrome c family protein